MISFRAIWTIFKDRGNPVAIIYSEIIWLGGAVLALTVAALTGLWRRQNLDEIEPVKPYRLSPAERELLLVERTQAIQKAIAAKSASRMARRERRRQLAAAATAADTTGSTT